MNTFGKDIRMFLLVIGQVTDFPRYASITRGSLTVKSLFLDKWFSVFCTSKIFLNQR